MDGKLFKMVDQTLLPYEFKYINIESGQQMFDAIKTMIVRGAPAIGVAGAHGVVLYAQELASQNLSRGEFVQNFLKSGLHGNRAPDSSKFDVGG